MRIAPLQSTFIINHNTEYGSKKSLSKPAYAKNINFGVTPEAYIVTRLFMMLERNVQKPERKKTECYNIIKNKIKKDFPELVNDLRTLSSNVDKGFFYWLGKKIAMTENVPKIKELKLLTLNEILPSMDDTDIDHRVAKKDFMMSLIDSGEHLNQAFLKQFTSMPNIFYNNFKEAVAEKSLSYALKNPKMANKAPDIYLFTLSLLQLLMTKEHQAFFNTNKNEIAQLLENIKDVAKSKLTKRENYAYINYLENFKEQGNWEKFTSEVFVKELKDSGFNKEKLMQNLNICDTYADFLLKELLIIANTKGNLSKEEKIEQYKSFIDEMLNEHFPYIYGEDDYLYKEQHYYYKKMAIEKFINSTDCKEELLGIYKPELNKLQSEYDRCKAEEREYKLPPGWPYDEGGFDPSML